MRGYGLLGVVFDAWKTEDRIRRSTLITDGRQADTAWDLTIGIIYATKAGATEAGLRLAIPADGMRPCVAGF